MSWEKGEDSVGEGIGKTAYYYMLNIIPILLTLTKRHKVKIYLAYATHEARDKDYLISRGIDTKKYENKIQKSMASLEKICLKINKTKDFKNLELKVIKMEKLFSKKSEKLAKNKIKEIRFSRFENLIPYRENTYKRMFYHHPNIKKEISN